MSKLIRAVTLTVILLSFNSVAFGQEKANLKQKIDLNAKLPVDSAVKIGKLENGLTYYIRKNVKPENRAELRLVVKAGSILEDDDQLGLAHFVEHMAFNGTEHFEKQGMVDFLESIGMEFGPEVNAYTSFDETVYMLQVPTDDAEKLDKSFLILEDWAHNVTFDETEIDKERGVIIEEWRLGRGAGARMRDKHLPVIFKDSRYAERLPIGKKEILETFKYETLVRFYKDWYRPDLMAVVAVGDFDVNAIEKLIIGHFSGIPKSENPRKREYYSVPDHKETLITVAKDKEAVRMNLEIANLVDREPEVTIEDYKRKVIRGLFFSILNNRYYELSRTADPPFTSARAGFTNYVYTKDAYTLSALIKDNDLIKGMEVLLREAERVMQHGITQTELDRQKKGLLRSMEKYFNERNKTESTAFASEYVMNFLEEEPIPGIEFEYQLSKQLIPEITLEEITSVIASLLKEENRVVIINSPEKENIEIPDSSTLLNIFSLIKKESLTPYEDIVYDDELLEYEPKPAEILSEKYIKEIDVTELKLSNGVRVILKSTDFKNDEIQFTAFSPGGNSLASDSNYFSAENSTSIVSEGGVGEFSKIELQKKLTGKVVRVSPWISELSEGLSGGASPADMEAMFELIYLYFYSPRKDSTSYLSYKSRLISLLENRSANPRLAFQDTLQVTLNQYHFRFQPWTGEKISKIDLDKAFEFYKDRFKDASDFTFLFVGNFSIDSIKPFIKAYLGNLPSSNRKETWKDIGRSYPAGIISKQIHRGIEPQSLVNLTFTGSFNWSDENVYNINALASILEIQLREILREDKSGTYGVGVYANPSRYPREDYSITISFGCDPKKTDELVEIVFNQIDSLKAQGADSGYISKVKEIGLRSREVELKRNEVWLNELADAYYYNEDPCEILEYEKLIRNLTSEKIQKASQKYFNIQNFVKIILYPESLPN